MRMQICPNCARALDYRDIICAFCGHRANGAVETPVPSDAVVDRPRAELAVIPPVAAAKPRHASRDAILVSAAIGAVVAVMFIVRSTGSNAQANAPVTPTAPVQKTPLNVVAPQPARIAPSESAGAPKWSRTLQSQWATDGSRTIGFELEAERDVTVYMDRVRPVLAVRCIAQQTEVFVVLRSAPSIENSDSTHAVRIGLDDEPDVGQRWLDSSNMQALFAPDGKALVARMATARRLRFAFTPFNAPPAAVEFDVHGFEGPLATMSKTCAPAKTRSIRARGASSE
jgi:hypothetical protein